MDSPSGTTDRTSGWLRLSTVWHAEHSPQPRLSGRSHCSAAANARAATDRPDPGGPVNSQACVIAPVGTSLPDTIARAAAAAFRRTATACLGRRGRPRPSRWILVSTLVRASRPVPDHELAGSALGGSPRRGVTLRRESNDRGRRLASNPSTVARISDASSLCRPHPIKQEIASRRGFRQSAKRCPNPFVELQRLAFKLRRCNGGHRSTRRVLGPARVPRRREYRAGRSSPA